MSTVSGDFFLNDSTISQYYNLEQNVQMDDKEGLRLIDIQF